MAKSTPSKAPLESSRILDQFYTAPHISTLYVDLVKTRYPLAKRWLEPSAGSGAFFNILPTPRIGFDLEPKGKDIINANFLTLSLLHNDYICIGNPPFGKNASLAVKFFNHAAKFSEVIAFIVPKTFCKDSVHKRLTTNFKLVYEDALPKNSFVFNGLSYDVPCVFQIWEKTSIPRTLPKAITSNLITFTTEPKAALAFQRVGVNAGAIKEPAGQSKSSHYFISCSKDTLSILKRINWSFCKNNTAGCPSISKSELVAAFLSEKAKP